MLSFPLKHLKPGSHHLHLYREGYGDKGAMPVPMDRPRTPDQTRVTYDDLLLFCNVTQPPYMQWGLFT